MKRIILALLLAATAARADMARDLIAAYFFDGNAEDASGNGLHAQMIGATWTQDRHGAPSGAALLDGTGAWISTPVDGRRFPFSMSFWFRLDARPGERPYSILDSGMGESFGHSFVIGSGPNTLNANLAANFAFAKGVWTHVAVSYGEQLKVYLNGALVGSREYSEDDSFVAGNLAIGRHAGSADARYFPGAVDDVMIFGRALADREAKELFENAAGVAARVQQAGRARAALAAARAAGIESQRPEGLEDGLAFPAPVAVTVSSAVAPGTNGWALVDGDAETVWSGAAEQPGWWFALDYDPPVTLSEAAIDVAFGASNIAWLVSEDGVQWREFTGEPATLTTLLGVLLDASEAPPTLRELNLK